MHYRQDIDNEPPEDPIFEEARTYTDLQLEGIQDDLDETAYEKLWQETYEAELKRLQEQRRIDIEHYNQLSPAQKKEFDEWDGRKPPMDNEWEYVTLEMLNKAFDIAEQETADWFNGHTCSMENQRGDSECPICFFRRRVKHILQVDYRWPKEHNTDNPPKCEETNDEVSI